MRRAVLILLAVPLLATCLITSIAQAEPEGKPKPIPKTFTSKNLNFEISLPKGIDWEWIKLSEQDKKQGCVVQLATIWAAAEPPSRSDVHVFVTKLSKEFAKKSAENIAKLWGETSFENSIQNPRNRKAEAIKLGSVDAWSNDVIGNNAADGSVWRLRYIVAKNGNYVYTIMIGRNGKLVDDEDLDEELATIVKSFKFGEIRKSKAHKKGGRKGGAPPAGGAGGGGKNVDPAKVKREEIELDFWRLKCVKPQGMLRLDGKTFDESEKFYNLILKFQASKPQSTISIRVFAKSLKSKGGFSIDKLVESRIKLFKKTYEKNKRQPPEQKKWKKVKGTKKGVYLHLLGRRKVTEVDRLYFLDHKNNRQYTIQIYCSGGTGDKAWKNEIKDFLDHFKPTN